MMRQWTIEARADFADPGKNEAFARAVKRARTYLDATGKLLAEGDREKGVQVRAYADDFFAGHEEFNGYDEIGEAMAVFGDKVGEEGTVSDEMLAALRQLKE